MERLLIYDDRCGFCLSSVRILRWLDWRKAHRYAGSSDRAALDRAGITAADADRELKLWVDGRLYGGYDAVREALRAMPATFPIAPLMGLRPVRWLGRRVYRAVAGRRRCTYLPTKSPRRL